jgi:hypothetical protein
MHCFINNYYYYNHEHLTEVLAAVFRSVMG